MGAQMRWIVVMLIGSLCVSGCFSRRSSLLLERRSRGPMHDTTLVGGRVRWELDPPEQTLEHGEVTVTVRFASAQFLNKLYSDRKIFGEFAGRDPFFPEQIVFYIRIQNASNERIKINPADFVLIDDRGNQYSGIDADYVDAIAESRQPVATMTRGVLQDARPGYFGLSVPVGKMVATKPIGRFALIKQSTLQAGYMYPEVTHDGILAFWSPVKDARIIKLLVSNIKTNFDANDLPQKTLEFPFVFTVIGAPAESAASQPAAASPPAEAATPSAP